MRTALFGLGRDGRSKAITAKSLTNMYVDLRPVGERSQAVAVGTPGLALFASAGANPWRGLLEFVPGDVAFGVNAGVLYEINAAGTLTNRGTLSTASGRVSMDHNGTQVMIVDGTKGYIWNTQTSTFSTITDPDFPASPQTVTFSDGYFVITVANSARFYISGLYDGTTWDALDFDSASSNPDNLVRVMADHGQVLLFGDKSTEFWTANGAADFPFGRVQGSTAEWGLGARWSLAKFDGTVAGLFTNPMGQVIVGKIAGYQLSPLSTPDMDATFNSYAVTSDASGYSYLLGGHPMYVLNFPTQGVTWLFDGRSGEWSKLKSADISRHRSQFGVVYQNKPLVSDYSNGNLYRLDAATYTDNGMMIEREIIGERVADGDLGRIEINAVRLEMLVGAGLVSGQGSDPQIMLQVSRDGANTWGRELWQGVGEIGDYLKRVQWNRFGEARKFDFKWRFTDPVPLVVVNAMVNPVD